MKRKPPLAFAIFSYFVFICMILLVCWLPYWCNKKFGSKKGVAPQSKIMHIDSLRYRGKDTLTTSEAIDSAMKYAKKNKISITIYLPPHFIKISDSLNSIDSADILTVKEWSDSMENSVVQKSASKTKQSKRYLFNSNHKKPWYFDDSVSQAKEHKEWLASIARGDSVKLPVSKITEIGTIEIDTSLYGQILSVRAEGWSMEGWHPDHYITVLQEQTTYTKYLWGHDIWKLKRMADSVQYTKIN